MTLPEVFEAILKTGGPFAALTFALIYYMRKDHRKDYEGVTKRLNVVEDYQKNKMTDTLEKNTAVIAENTQVIAENTRTMDEVKMVIHQYRQAH